MQTSHFANCVRILRFPIWVAASLFCFGSVAMAQMTLNPYVDARIEHDSNVFRVPNSQALLLYSNDGTLGDTDQRYIAGLEGTYLWSQQQLTGQFEARKINYDHYTDLNHNEYLADADLKWQLTRTFDGFLDFRQERAMAPFDLNNSNALTLNLDRKISGRLNVNFAPDWRFEAGLYSHTLDSPLQDYPDFVEREIGSHLALDYLGRGNLTYGLAFDRIDGKLENAINVGPYTQDSAALTLTYLVSGSTTMNAAVGYSKREQGGNSGGSYGGFTGNLGYTRQLTGKTSINLQLSRAVNTYAAAGSSEVDTSASAGVLWQATYKLAASASYGYTHSSFIGQNIPGADSNGRADHYTTENLAIKYQILRRISLRAYFTKQNRASTVNLFEFDDKIYGLEAHWNFGKATAN